MPQLFRLPPLLEANLHFTFDDLELYMLVETTLTLGSTYTATIQTSSGFHLKLNDGLAIDIAFFGDNVSDITLPAVISSPCLSLSRRLLADWIGQLPGLPSEHVAISSNDNIRDNYVFWAELGDIASLGVQDAVATTAAFRQKAGTSTRTGSTSGEIGLALSGKSAALWSLTPL
ncbi:hypothetical protein EJ03DRAFT_380191 [Teratosphaeria nubilosa]|uniref:Uncharacterized protein n=1 Tax=Teratosphaeria nubilosa TaxID=161662 RepID=A0A6G1LLK9_9PEZI|nr:hypothetical protein EJ03DRAFT_380191 [Teratosphaeria nubilosa]